MIYLSIAAGSIVMIAIGIMIKQLRPATMRLERKQDVIQNYPRRSI